MSSERDRGRKVETEKWSRESDISVCSPMIQTAAGVSLTALHQRLNSDCQY